VPNTALIYRLAPGAEKEPPIAVSPLTAIDLPPCLQPSRHYVLVLFDTLS